MSNILLSGSSIFFATSSLAYGPTSSGFIVTQSHIVARWEVDEDEDAVVLKSEKDASAGSRLLLKASRGTDKAIQTGDIAGEIDFVIASSSFGSGKINASGSLANIRAEVKSVTKAGATGKLIFSMAKSVNADAQALITYEYSPQSLSAFAQQHTASLLLND